MEKRLISACLLGLPLEIRLAIYECLLVNSVEEILSIRAEPDGLSCQRKPQHRLRSTVWILADRFRGRSVETTYYLSTQADIYPSILRVNHQIHDEGVRVLYGRHIFDFNADIEVMVPFLEDLTPLARHSIRRLNLVKRPLPYDREFDRAEWRWVCSYISENLNLVQLQLGIHGGKPAGTDTLPVTHYSASDFKLMSRMEALEWVAQLIRVKGLRRLDVVALLDHCPPPNSSAMSFFIDFSASIETGFADYLRSEMVLQEA